MSVPPVLDATSSVSSVAFRRQGDILPAVSRSITDTPCRLWRSLITKLTFDWCLAVDAMMRQEILVPRNDPWVAAIAPAQTHAILPKNIVGMRDGVPLSAPLLPFHARIPCRTWDSWNTRCAAWPGNEKLFFLDRAGVTAGETWAEPPHQGQDLAAALSAHL